MTMPRNHANTRPMRLSRLRSLVDIIYIVASMLLRCCAGWQPWRRAYAGVSLALALGFSDQVPAWLNDRVSMIRKMPRRFPALADMLRDLSVTPAELAKALGVNKSTVYRWLDTGQAPRTAMLAIYWATSWGQSELDAETFNRANLYQSLAEALRHEVRKLEQQIQRLSQTGLYGSANDPLPRVPAAQDFPARPSTEFAETHRLRLKQS